MSHEGAALCLDMGQGAFAGLAGRLEPADLAGIVISHLHPDHFVDLVALRHYLRYEFDPPRRLRVIAPAGLAGRLDGVTGEADFAGGSFEIEDRGEGHVQVGPFDIESRRVTHTADSFATRVRIAGAPATDGPALVYSGDCGRAADLAPLIRPGDVLLSEVAFGPGPVPVPDLHLDGTAVGRLAAETRVSQRASHPPPDESRSGGHARGGAGRVQRPGCARRRRGSGRDRGLIAPRVAEPGDRSLRHRHPTGNRNPGPGCPGPGARAPRGQPSAVARRMRDG